MAPGSMSSLYVWISLPLLVVFHMICYEGRQRKIQQPARLPVPAREPVAGMTRLVHRRW